MYDDPADMRVFGAEISEPGNEGQSSDNLFRSDSKSSTRESIFAGIGDDSVGEVEEGQEDAESADENRELLVMWCFERPSACSPTQRSDNNKTQGTLSISLGCESEQPTGIVLPHLYLWYYA